MVSGMTREAFQNHQSFGKSSFARPATTAARPLSAASTRDSAPSADAPALARRMSCSYSSLTLPRLPIITTKKTPASPARTGPMRIP